MKQGLRSSIYRNAIVAILGCCIATALVILIAGEYLLRESYDSAREASIEGARDRFEIYDYLVTNLEERARGGAEAALLELGRLYPDSAAIARATARGLRADAVRLGVTDVFLIGPSGRIGATSFEEDFGLDILSGGKKYQATLRALYGSGRVAHQSTSESARTGKVASYHYYSPKGSDLIIEVSKSLRDSVKENYQGNSAMSYDELLALLVGGRAESGSRASTNAPRHLVRLDDLVGLAGGMVWSFSREGTSKPELVPLVADAAERGSSSVVRGRVETIVLHMGEPHPGSEVAGARYFAILEVDLSPLWHFRIVAILMALVACALSALIAFLSSKRAFDRGVSERVERLEESIARIAAGDYGSSVEVDGEDEISAIARGVAAMVRTISERNEELAASLSEKETLLREVHHRVKNNLQIIASLISLQISESPDPGVNAALSETRTRVYGMALVHDELYKGLSLSGVALGPCLAGIAADVDVNRRRPGLVVDIGVEVEAIVLATDKALPACLVASELIANCYEHAFPGRLEGKVLVRAQGSAEGGFELSVEDDGVGAGLAREGLGLGIARALASQLKGELRRGASPSGGERYLLVVPGERA